MQNLLLQKLEEFIALHHRNLLIRGVVRFVLWALTCYLAVALLGYFGSTSSVYRAVLLLGWLSGTVFIFWKYLRLPLLSWLLPRKRLTGEQASLLLGKHFPEVADRLLNTLQLSRVAEHDVLAMRAVEQRVSQLKDIPFVQAVDWKGTRQILPYLLLPFVLMGLLALLGYGSALIEGPRRVVRYNEAILAEMPFTLRWEGPRAVVEGEDLPIRISASGRSLPTQVEVLINGQRLPMQQTGEASWQYQVREVQEPFTAVVSTGEFSSPPVEVEVIRRPRISNFQVEVDYPAHTGLRDELANNKGDWKVPEGTKLSWKLNGRQVSGLLVVGGKNDSMEVAAREGLMTWNETATSTETRKWYINNRQTGFLEAATFRLDVVPDRYPRIDVEQLKGEDPEEVAFSGGISDDYGFRDLRLVVRWGDSLRRTNVPLTGDREQRVFVPFSWNSLPLQPGQQAEVYLELRDNDALHGYKSVRSGSFVYRALTKEERKQQSRERTESLEQSAKEMTKAAEEMQRSLQDLRKRSLEKKELDWKDRRNVDELLDRHRRLEDELKRLQEEYARKLEEEKNWREPSEQLQEKQRQLQELMEKVLDEETREMLEKLEELREKIDKDKLKEVVEKLSLRQEELERELERDLELMRQIEMEQRVEEHLAELEQLEREQRQLMEETGREDAGEQQQRQQELQQRVEELEQEMKETEQKNQEMENSWPLPEEQGELQKASEEMQKSSQEMNNGNPSKSKPHQKEAADQLQKKREDLESMMMEMSAQQAQANLEDVRKLLDQLIKLSHAQERTMEKTVASRGNDPAVRSYMESQRQLRDGSRVVQDSLEALALRAPQIEPVVARRLSEVQMAQRKALDDLTERNLPQAGARMREIMTGFNELGLLLDNAMEQMQQQMANQMKGEQSCQKPGSGKPSMSNMRKLQQALSKQMQQMQQQMPGNQPGGVQGKPGSKMSKEVVEMMARQEAIRRQLEEMAEGEKDNGANGTKSNMMKMIEEMKENERDLANMNFNRRMMERQKDLEMRLLESERAERERGEKEEREAETVKDTFPASREKWEDVLREREREIEYWRTLPPELVPYYRKRVEEFMEAGRGEN